jgi:penicillin-binding protein 1A
MEIDVKKKKYIRIFWIVVSIPVFLLILIFSLINMGAFGKLPGFHELENPNTNLATEVYSADGELLGKYFEENRTVVEFDDVSPNVLNALIATEDIRFYSHSGIDARALTRVVKGLLTMDLSGGGSTITQQLAKNLYNMRRDSSEYETGLPGKLNLVITKFKEWVTAVRLERNYTKQEIIAMYLNTVDFGSNAFGIKSAARTYFNTSPDSLKLEEAATLIGILKAPTKYNPKFNPDNALIRRNTVLSQIEKYQRKLKKLHDYKPQSKQYYDSLQKLPIVLDYNVQSHTKGLARHFREYIRLIMYKEKPVAPEKMKKIKNITWKDPEYKKYKKEIAEYEQKYIRFLEDSTEWVNNELYGWCNKNLKPDGSRYNIYKDGLKIYTTINTDMQIYAEESVAEHMGDYLQPLFYKRHKNRKNAPFSWNMSEEQIKRVYDISIKRTDRYRLLKKQKKDSTEIAKIFNTPVQMKVFSWKGSVDTIMSPLDSIKYYKFFLHAGLMSLEPQTGYVRAYVGDIDYDYFRFDNVSLSKRQVGSTFKPFVYSMAMEDKMSPCHQVPNVPVTIDLPEGQFPPTWTPQFSPNEKLDGKMVSLKIALALSLNQISAWIMKKYGAQKIVEIAHKTGIKSYIPFVPSICVGSAEVKLSEMVGAYDTYANGGIHVEPVFVTRIEDRNGNIIAKFKSKSKEAINQNTAYRMIDLMKGVVDYGTSTRIRYTYNLTNEIAGKTGTTNDNSDGWFIGIVPNLVTGIWVGGEERSIRFMNSADGQGSNMALPIWALYMQKVYKNSKLGISKEPFKKPDLYDGVILDCSQYEQSDSDNEPINLSDDENY